MIKGVKKIISVLVLACMIVGVAAPQTILASGEEEGQTAEEEGQASDLKIEEPVIEDEPAEGELTAGESEADQSIAEISVKEDIEPEEVELEDEEQEEQEEPSNEAEDGIIEKNSHEVNFILIKSPYLETPGTQQIFVSYGDGTEQVEEMTLDLQDESGNLEVLELSNNKGTIFLFEKTFSDNSATGTYVITKVHVTDDSGSQDIVLSDLGMDARFGVNKEYDGIEALKPLDEETAEEESEGAVTATIASIEGDGEDAVDEVVNALENAENDVDFASVPQTLASKSSDIVVALDPGHDSSHMGASGNGFNEHELTLKIANYCKEELETYQGVSVYMTRTSASCPYPSTKSSASGDDIKLRVEASVAQGAKYYVSIHINDADSSSANGAEVIIPNSNWKPSIATQGKELAQVILDELEKAGMSLRSTPIYTRDSESGSKYSDGSTADYYAVNKQCKLNGIPGIIVEHGFISNSSDVSNFLSSNSGLKKLGVADATGIATYLGLSKGLSTPSLKSATAAASGTTLKWSSVSGAAGYAIYRKPSGGSWSMIDTTTSTSYTDKESLTSGNTYYYTVRAFAESESKAMSNKYDTEYWSSYDKNGLKAVYLSPPKLTGATTGASSTTISWNKVSGAKGYAVYRKKSGGSWSMLTTTTSTSYKDKSSLSSGKTYYYTVRAYVGSASTAKNNTYNAAYWSGYDSTGVKAVYLSVPKLSTAKSAASGTKISWGKVNGASGYAVYRKKSGGSWSMLTTTTKTNYTDKTSLSGGKTYYYTVRAYKGNVSTAKSNKYNAAYWSGYDSTGLKSVYLAKPKLNKATAAVSGTKISWESVTGAKGYAIYRKKSGGSWSMITTTTKTSYTDKSKLSDGETYYYMVRAYRGSVAKAKKNKNNPVYWGGYDSTGLKSVYLANPKLSSVKSTSSGTKINWGKVSDASGYAVYRKKSGGSWSMLTLTTKTSYTDKANLSGGMTYYYTVRAYKGSDSTAKNNKYNAAYWSGYDSTGLKSVYLAGPKLNEATATASGTKISWESVTGAKGYAVYRKRSGGSWSMITTTTKTSYTDKSNLSGGKTYYYMVRAYRKSAATAKKHKNNPVYWGGYDSTGLKTVYLSNPKLVSASGASGSVKIKWSSVSGADGYAIYRKTSGGSWKMIDTTTSTSYTDKATLTLGKTYYYTVRAYKGSESTAKANKYNAAYWSGYNSSGVSFTVPGLSTPKLSGTKVVNEGIKLSWNSVSNASGYAVFRKTSGGSWKRIGTTTGTSYTDKDGGSSGTTYYYTVRAYLGSKSDALDHKYDSSYWSSYDKSGVAGSAYAIAGDSTVTVKQMVAYFNASGKSYPSVYKSKGAATITDMAQIYYDEAKAEGIKVEVAWCQMILETGYLQFNGRVSASQCNFAGIGATDDVSTGGGATFSSVTEGVRAQIQHLKAYASTSSLNNACVDPRFNLVSRGCAKYVEILGSYENPTGNGWATGKGYGPDIVGMIKDLKKM